MILTETDFQVEMLYMGPGKGCRKAIRCDEIGFHESIDCEDEVRSRAAIFEVLEQCIFDKFVLGEFEFDSSRQDIARESLALPNNRLIDRAFSNNAFTRSFIRLELKRRDIFDDDLYRLGLHGDEFTRSQAIDLLKQQAEQEVAGNSDHSQVRGQNHQD